MKKNLRSIRNLSYRPTVKPSCASKISSQATYRKAAASGSFLHIPSIRFLKQSGDIDLTRNLNMEEDFWMFRC